MVAPRRAAVRVQLGLARVKANLDQRDAEQSYGLDGDQLTPWLSWSAHSLRKDWNQAKHEIAPWWGENSKEAYSSGLANLATALKNWGDSRSSKRKGRKLGFPGSRAGGQGCRAGSPLARSGSPTTAGT